MDTGVLDRLSAAEAAPRSTAQRAEFGFWIYLMSDCVLFAALFATFVVLGRNDAGGPTGKQLFNLPYTLGETLFLLTSSVTCGFAMLGARSMSPKQVLFWLAVTFLLGLGFVGMEVNEFLRLALAGDGPQRSGFLSGFFVLVGTHGAHVTAGLFCMLVMAAQVLAKGLTERVRSRLLRLSMFWHFLDLVWIGVFTIVYLKGAM